MPREPKQDRELLEAALIGFEQMRERLQSKIAELRSQIGGSSWSGSGASGSAPAGRTMSPAARHRIALAQKKRWAAYKAQHGQKAGATKPGKRAISAEGRARIIAATKKRWAAYRKEQQAKQAS